MTQQLPLLPDARPKNIIGSSLLFLGMSVSSAVFGLLLVAGMVLPFKLRWRIGHTWCRLVGWMVKRCCGLTYTIEGLDSIDPTQPVIFLSNHQSAWETIALRELLPPHSVVVKKELLYLPIWGWGLMTLKTIVIDRKNQRGALRAVVEQGSRYIQEGLCVLMFPEGTRSSAGTIGKFNAGGAMLAQKTGIPVVPIVHNAGEFWPRYSFFKYPGVIKVKIGPRIESQGRKPQEINAEVEDWIRQNFQSL
jgi:1-acyl-sn-glycerol-3-phosphate acyltransferase